MNNLMLNIIQLFNSDIEITESKFTAILKDNNKTDLIAILEGSKNFINWFDTLFRYEFIIDISEEKTILRLNKSDLQYRDKTILGKSLDNAFLSTIIHNDNNNIKNYDGIILSLLDFFKNNSELSEKDLTNLIKSILIVNTNKSDYLNKIKIGGTNFFNTLILSIQKILIEQTTIQINSKERLYSPLEVANILNTTKATIINYINKGLISSTKYKQTIKGGKILIYSSGIDELIIEKVKYKNLWLNRNL